MDTYRFFVFKTMAQFALGGHGIVSSMPIWLQQTLTKYGLQSADPPQNDPSASGDLRQPDRHGFFLIYLVLNCDKSRKKPQLLVAMHA